MPHDKVGLIFRKYGRANPRGPGLGLGLYIARQLARIHGGDLTYRHAVSRGALLELTLPLATPPGGGWATDGAVQAPGRGG